MFRSFPRGGAALSLPANAGRSALAASVLLLSSTVPSRAGDAIVGNCSNDVELRATIASVQSEGGGNITFSCPASTITVGTAFQVPGHVSIDGENKITLSGGNSSRIFESGGSGVLSLKDIVLTKGSSAGDGGAISSQGSLFLDHVTIQDAVSGGSGGAIVAYGTTIITDSEIANNKALNGGALYPRFAGAQVSIQNSTLHHNQTTSTTDGWGGAILIWDGASVSVVGSNFHHNMARTGGAIHNKFASSSLSLQGSTFQSNSTTLADGGAVYALGPLSVTGCTFLFNSANHYGGGVSYGGTATSKIAQSLFVQNHAGDGGGAVDFYQASGMTISNSTLTDNSARFGGALTNSFSHVSLVNVTISFNSATDGASGIAIGNYNDESTTLQNTIVASSTGGPNCIGTAKLESADGNLVDDDSCAASLNKLHDLNGTAYAPIFSTLGDHGGPTLTRVPGPGSPAIDAGVSNSLTEDQRGFQRPRGDATDIGAVEVVPCPGGAALCGDANESGGLTAGDALLALRAAVGSISCAPYLCDINASGDLTASDALLILRKSVGQQVTSSCPAKWDCHA